MRVDDITFVPPDMAASRLFLIDGSNQMYRAYHALPPMTNATGQVTHAVYGFVTMLLKLIADHKPEFIAASFDLAGPTFRRDLAADYKATRSPMPNDLIDQVPLVHQACRALGVPILTTDRYEADDVMGTLARQAAAQGLRRRAGDRRQGLLPAGRRSDPGLQPARAGHVVRRRRREAEVRRAAASRSSTSWR